MINSVAFLKKYSFAASIYSSHSVMLVTSLFDCMFLSCHIHVSVNPHSIVAWKSRNSLLKAGAKSEVSSLLSLTWSNSFIGKSLSFLIQSKPLILVKSAIILWLDMKSHSVNLRISITLFLTHCLTAFSWLLSQWSITWLPVTFIVPLLFSWSALLKISPVRAFMIVVNNSPMGCDKPSGINFDLEKICCHEWYHLSSKILHILPHMQFLTCISSIYCVNV